MYSLKQLIALMAGVGAGGEISDNPFCVGELTVIKLSGHSSSSRTASHENLSDKRDIPRGVKG